MASRTFRDAEASSCGTSGSSCPSSHRGIGRDQQIVHHRAVGMADWRSISPLVCGTRCALCRYLAPRDGFPPARDPDVVLEPDLAFARIGAFPPPDERNQLLKLAPDLLVEFVPPIV